MPIDDLTALGQKMREARKNKELTQQELSDLSHVSVKQIANIEKGKMNPSYLILRALAKSNRKDSFYLFRYWRFALQKHGSDQKVPVVSVLYSFGLPAFFALKQLNHQSA